MMSIYYDGDCPFCAAYTRLVRLRENVGAVQLVNLRDSPTQCARLAALGLDLDKGMVVEYEGKTWHGAAAMSLLARLSGTSGLFGVVNCLFFYSSFLSFFIYPILRVGRNLVLLLMGRQRLNDGDPATTNLFLLFSVAWGVLACLYFTY